MHGLNLGLGSLEILIVSVAGLFLFGKKCLDISGVSDFSLWTYGTLCFADKEFCVEG